MADEKDKGKGKPPAAPSGLSGTETIIAAVVILAVVSAILNRLYAFVATGELTFFGFSLSNLWVSLKINLPFIKTISYAVSATFTFAIVVLSQLRGTVILAEKKELFPQGEPAVGSAPVDVKNPMTDRWKQVHNHIESSNPSDWRQAIIEADVMLAELLEKLHLPGDTVGDKMKAVEKSDFTTIDLAWEAHKVRNQIAHEGSEFLLNDREARRIVDLYRRVFEEFFMI